MIGILEMGDIGCRAAAVHIRAHVSDLVHERDAIQADFHECNLAKEKLAKNLSALQKEIEASREKTVKTLDRLHEESVSNVEMYESMTGILEMGDFGCRAAAIHIRAHVSDLVHERDDLDLKIAHQGYEKGQVEGDLSELKARIEASPKRWIVAWDGYENDGNGPSKMYFDREDAESVATQEHGTASQVYCVSTTPPVRYRPGKR